MKKDEIIITDHAYARAEEIGIPIIRIKDLLLNAKKQKSNIFREIYKISKYGIKQSDIVYYFRKGSTRYPPLLFTVLCEEDKWVIITITKK